MNRSKRILALALGKSDAEHGNENAKNKEVRQYCSEKNGSESTENYSVDDGLKNNASLQILQTTQVSTNYTNEESPSSISSILSESSEGRSSVVAGLEISESEYFPSGDEATSDSVSDDSIIASSILSPDNESRIQNSLKTTNFTSRDPSDPTEIALSDVAAASLSHQIPVIDNLLTNDYVEGSDGANYPQNTENNENCLLSALLEQNKQFTRSQSARERPVICPICYEDVMTHFARHLLRRHKNNNEVRAIRSLKPGSKERIALIMGLRKQGYFHQKNERNIINPVKSSRKAGTNYFVCTYCLGQYSKPYLHKHVKVCKSRPLNSSDVGKKCLSESQTFMALITAKNNEFLKSSRIRHEVFSLMRADEISATAKNDPLICLYGEALISKHKRKQIAAVISNKMRELSRLVIALKPLCNISGLFEALKPDFFQHFVSATKIISGYDVQTRSFKSPSLALHMGTNLKVVCDVALKIVLEKKNIPNIKWENHELKKNEIKDLKKLITGHWCSEMSSLELKNLKENNWQKPLNLPLTKDIQLFQQFLDETSKKAFENLNNAINIRENYKTLMECVLTLTVMFNRKRVGDVQYLTIDTYSKDSRTINQDTFTNLLSPVEKIICKKFKRVVSGGKGSKPVPILFPKRIQLYIDTLLKIRKDNKIVPESNTYLFANPGSDQWLAGSNIIRKLAKKCGALHPDLLTSTKFRKHIATTLQLLCMEDDEIEQIASFMGHTKKTHSEFYRLPQDIYQTAKVAKILMLLEKGRGSEFRGKSLDEIDLKTDIYYSSESENEKDDEMPLSERILKETVTRDALISATGRHELNLVEPSCSSTENRNEEKRRCSGSNRREVQEEGKQSRKKWTEREKTLIRAHFESHIKKKIAPRKYECDEFKEKNASVFNQVDWVKIKTFVYNEFRIKN